MIKNKRILILAPHTDDGEFGCGGTINKFLEMDCKVFYVAFSSAEKSLPEGLPKDTLKKEVKEATSMLGIIPENLILLNYDVREFPQHRQEILEDMITFQKEINPDIVFLPSTFDTHQDHNTISSEGFRAFKRTTMLGYEIPWNNLTFNTSSFSILSEQNILAKIKSLECYKSQAFRTYASSSFIKSLAVTRGTQIGAEFAEVFEVIRWIIK